jgi:hypothetical protein
VNVLALAGMTMAEITGAGAQPVSVGGGLAWVAVTAPAAAARGIREHGDLSAFGKSRPLRESFA